MDLQKYYEQNKVRLTSSSDYPSLMCKHLCEKFGIKSGSKLLDVGSGVGIQCSNFANIGLEVYGVDNIDLPTSNNFTYVKADLTKNNIPFEDDTFDVVFSKSVIEHIVDPELFLIECNRVLKQGGMLIILTPDWQTQSDVFYDDPTHVHPYTKTSLKYVLELYGFKNVNSEIFTQIPIVWKFKFLKLFTFLCEIIPFSFYKFMRRTKYLRFAREKMVLASAIK